MDKKTWRVAIILKKNFDSNSVSISQESNVLHIDDEPHGAKLTNFFYNLQLHTKK